VTPRRPSKFESRLLTVAGIVLLLGGIGAGWSRVRTGGTDFSVFHAMGVGILRGVNVYELNDPGQTRENVGGVHYPPGIMGLIVYPPATGFAMAPLALLPLREATILWFLILNATVILGVRSLVRLVSPTAPPATWTIAAGVVLLSAAIRWGMMLLQGAPLVLGLLCFFVVAVHTDRPRLATGLAALAMIFKTTLALPFVGLLLLARRFGAVVACGVTWVALNCLGFLRMGSLAYPAYRRSVADFDALGEGNINSPDPWSVVARPRLDWVTLFYGIGHNLRAARLASLLCSAFVVTWLLRVALRRRARHTASGTSAFLAPLLCLGSLCVYHHHYDLCLFFAPLIIAVLGASDLRRPIWAVMLAMPLVAIILFLPIGPAQALAESLLGLRGVGLLKLAFPVALTLALVGSMGILGRRDA
jgi:hypothetical protein